MKKAYMRLPTVITTALLLLPAFGGLSRLQAQSHSAALGAIGTVWGGTHVELEVTAEGATLEFDCASGTITKPLQVDAQGNFKGTGTFMREHPGPVMRNGPPPAPATYSGSIQKGTMKLSITSGAQDESQGEYVLTQGKSGRVFKCK
jgi:hypothetical protein